MIKFTRHLVFLSILVLFLVPAWAQELSDIIIVGYDAEVPAGNPNNPMQIRADRDGNIIWQKPIPLLRSGGDAHRYGSRNQTEDALYLSSYDVVDQIDGKNRLLKLDAIGDVVWDIPFSTSPIYLSANPVDGGVYALEYPPGNALHKLDSDGNAVWTISGNAFYGLSSDPITGGVFAAVDNNVLKLASDGSVVWSRAYLTIPYKLHANPIDGGVYVGYYDYGRFTDRLDGDGNKEWTKTYFPSNWTYGRSVSPLDGSLFIGSGWAGRIARVAMDGTVVFNIPSNEAYLPYISAAIDEMAAYTGDYAQHGVTKLAGDGTVIWQKSYDPPSWVGRYGVMHVYTGMPATDIDGDGVFDAHDACSDTVIPEGVPTKRLGVNRWALHDSDGVFDTTLPKGGGRGTALSFTIEETGGCSCEQIIDAFDLGKGHEKFGCSNSAMNDFVDIVNP
jgi:hypothetical protein